jgi:hypothetical protein
MGCRLLVQLLLPTHEQKGQNCSKQIKEILLTVTQVDTDTLPAHLKLAAYNMNKKKVKLLFNLGRNLQHLAPKAGNS